MKSIIILLSALVLMSFRADNLSKGYEIGDKVEDFSLKDVKGKMVSMADYLEIKGFTIIFTCNHCPFSKAYEDRIMDIHSKYGADFPVIAINPNDPAVQPEDSFEKMQERAKEKKFLFHYVFDEGQEVYPKWGATKTPHVFLVQKQGNSFVLKYKGAIDDNYQDSSEVSNHYLVNAIEALQNGEAVEVTETRAIGCSIKVKK